MDALAYRYTRKRHNERERTPSSSGRRSGGGYCRVRRADCPASALNYRTDRVLFARTTRDEMRQNAVRASAAQSQSECLPG